MKEIKQEMKIKENITAFTLKDPSEKDLALIKLAIRHENNNILERLKAKGVITNIDRSHNLIANVGRGVLAQLLAGDNTYSGEINYGAVGTGENPPSNSDTQLQTEVFRTLASSSAVDGNIAYIDFFIDKADTSGTFKEFGNFIDGEAGADTGQLFSRVAVNWVKTLTDSLFIACRYTIN